MVRFIKLMCLNGGYVRINTESITLIEKEDGYRGAVVWVEGKLNPIKVRETDTEMMRMIMSGSGINV